MWEGARSQRSGVVRVPIGTACVLPSGRASEPPQAELITSPPKIVTQARASPLLSATLGAVRLPAALFRGQGSSRLPLF